MWNGEIRSKWNVGKVRSRRRPKKALCRHPFGNSCIPEHQGRLSNLRRSGASFSVNVEGEGSPIWKAETKRCVRKSTTPRVLRQDDVDKILAGTQKEMKRRLRGSQYRHGRLGVVRLEEQPGLELPRQCVAEAREGVPGSLQDMPKKVVCEIGEAFTPKMASSFKSRFVATVTCCGQEFDHVCKSIHLLYKDAKDENKYLHKAHM